RRNAVEMLEERHYQIEAGLGLPISKQLASQVDPRCDVGFGGLAALLLVVEHTLQHTDPLSARFTVLWLAPASPPHIGYSRQCALQSAFQHEMVGAPAPQVVGAIPDRIDYEWWDQEYDDDTERG